MNESTLPNPSSPSGEQGRILVLAPDDQLANAVLAALREAAPGASVDVAHSLEEAQQLVVNQRPDLFVLDIDATYDLGQEFLYDLRTSHPNARAIVLTAVHRDRAADIGAIHFLEKPFPHGDFVTLVDALLHAGAATTSGEEKFRGTLSDLHIADIIQLKCMSGATSVLEFTGPRGEKARVFFENGQVRHATAPGKDGVAAFNEIVSWKGGNISEVSGATPAPRTIDFDWQLLLMESVRQLDEDRSSSPNGSAPVETAAASQRKVLVIDDSVMLLNFVKEILLEANYDVVAAPTAEEGLRAATSETPNLILLDYVLPDMKGDEVLSRLMQEPDTARVPVVYMSGFGADLKSDPKKNPNVIGSLNKPFTSELLLKTVETHMPKEASPPEQTPSAPPPVAEPTPEAPRPESAAPPQPEWTSPHIYEAPTSASEPQNLDPEPQAHASVTGEVHGFEPAPVETQSFEPLVSPALGASATPTTEGVSGGDDDAWWSAAPTRNAWPDAAPEPTPIAPAFEPQPPQEFSPAPMPAPAPMIMPAEVEQLSASAYFCGDTSFFSLNWALHAIGAQKLTGTLRCFWEKQPVELLAREGKILVVTTRDPELYCAEAPITLVNLEEERVTHARQVQRETSRPLFITLAQEGLIIREPAVQLVQHYGPKLFAQLWSAPRVRFIFEQSDSLPSFANEVPAEDDIDHWALSTLRFIQFTDLGNKVSYDQNSIPAYTRDGFERVQRLRLTVAEAQFASQFNGSRSIAQIAKNLRLDLKFARLTLFRFLALEIVDCWPPSAPVKQEKRGVFGKLFGE